jgi:hypothetical protein
VPVARGVKVGIIGTVFAGMLGVAGFGAYNILSSLRSDDGGGGSASSSSAKTLQPPSAKEISRTADAFLTAWSSGDTAKAAGLTDSVQTATAALAGYRDQAHVTSVHVAAGAQVAAKVSFTVTAQETYEGVASTWIYGSALTVGRNAGGDPAVVWAPSVLNPALGDGESLQTGRAGSPGLDIVDRHGTAMDPADYPSLTDVFAQLRTRYAAKAGGGTPGIETWVRAADGSEGRTLHVLKAGRNATLKTTLDADVQKAAETAVKRRAESGVVALQASTGKILALAFNSTQGDLAIGASVAPGSTFKVVTAAGLLARGVKPSDHVSCARQYAAPGGKPYTNVEKSSNPDADFRWDFANSCNTAFVRLSSTFTPDTLPAVARDDFGIGPTWNTGIQSFDGKVPGGTGDEMTSEMIGQGMLQMNPLIMASVAATAKSGSFHQPVIVSRSLIDGPIATANGLSPGVAQNLRSMMHTTAVSGTGAQAMSTVGGVKGAKTGSAEAGSVQPNGWFLGYSDDVAAAALVLDGGHGGDSAGPIVAAVLRAG